MTEETPRRGRGRKKGGTPRRKREPLDVRVIITREGEPSPEYLAMWRHLLLGTPWPAAETLRERSLRAEQAEPQTEEDA
jgi:hypothetical protein